jgi:hypothetical protein
MSRTMSRTPNPFKTANARIQAEHPATWARMEAVRAELIGETTSVLQW